MSELTLHELYNTVFPELYWKLLKNEVLSGVELETLLAIGIFLVGAKNKNLQMLGYRLFLMYSKVTEDYKPLYELSLNKGLIPISQFIEENLNYRKYGNLYTYINRIINNKYRWNDSYKTLEQYKLHKMANESNLNSQIIVAPTSYGKTELILSFIDNSEYKKICIVTPTKSLLAQTKKRIINYLGYRKIVTYPEMYSAKDDELIAVLTQERLLRLLQNDSSLKFDLLVIDEAHNLLDRFTKDNLRSILLTSVIVICNKRNNKLICKYLTPFLKSRDSLLIEGISEAPDWYSIEENIKSEIFYFYNLKENKKRVLDQYSTRKDKLIDIDSGSLGSDADVVINNCDKKNIIYLNSPKDLESFAKELSVKLPYLQTDKLKKAVYDLREYVHEDYRLADYMERGVIYHHGSIPEPIRYFIEDLYIDLPEIRMLISNSTLLEGVNIPATKMFILDPCRGRSYLSPSSFKNLVGRVCRFGEIFNKETGNLKYLLPEICIVNGQYCRKNFKEDSFIKTCKMLVMSYDKIKDEVKNPLLCNTSASEDDKKKARDFLENVSTFDVISEDYDRKPKTRIGELCFENSVNIFNILENEDAINERLSGINKAQTLDEVFNIADYLFFSKITDKNDNIKRLRQQEAQNFYKMLIEWRIKGLTMNEMITHIVNYWKTLRGEDKIVYVGKWGDLARGGYMNLWTNIEKKSYYEKVNLAIVRLKEEYDFIDNEIIKYIEILNSLALIENSLYLKIKYGTDDEEKIALLNCGISSILSNLLYDKYKDFFETDIKQSIISFKEGLIAEMIKNKENGVLITEVKMNSKD
jgi:hypothetical protein